MGYLPSAETEGGTPLDYTILEAYRHNLYHGCFTRAADALFDVCDALLTDVGARSFVELSQAASFQRAWPSLYEALEDGRIDRRALIEEPVIFLARQAVIDQVLISAGANVMAIAKIERQEALFVQEVGARQSSRLGGVKILRRFALHEQGGGLRP